MQDMTPFLKQVARHYCHTGAGDISRLCFIFPNRRAMRFFERYLGEEIALSSSCPVISPQLFTMNDFFYRTVGARPCDRTGLLLELYSCYKALNPGAESLDDFIFWGDTLLGDFDDIDKYLVDPERLFANVEDLKSMQDDLSWLTPAQKEAIERFTRHFLTPGAVKEGFLRIWRILLPLYRDFRAALSAGGLSYEGMVYRSLTEKLEKMSAVDLMKERHPWSGRFVFVGLNALNECEKSLLRKMHRAGLCEFCWDYRSDFIRNADNKSSLFLKDFVSEFPSSFEPDPEGLPDTEFNLLTVAGGVAQAKMLPEIFSRCNPSPGIDTAVVLPDEKMLIPVLNSIPGHVDKLNVTMGYPISGSQMWSLISDLSGLQLHLRLRDGEYCFYHRPLWAVLSNPVVRTVLSEETARRMEELRRQRLYYIPESSLKGDAVLETIFRPIVSDLSAADPVQVRDICRWLQDVLTTIAPRLGQDADMQIEIDFAKLCHEGLSGLLRHELALLPQSLFRLVAQLLSSAAVPFEGEPLEGLQIMGPLELRAMDFDNLVILNFNEGVFPRRSVSASFIPPELRRGFGLPTYEYQDAVWAYYFYRMIQRASRVWLVCDSRAEGLKGGEPSRYLYQLEMHFGVKVRHLEAVMPLGRGQDGEQIPKTEEHILKLRRSFLSPSAVRNYMDCPVKFFYSKVESLRAEKDLSESLDPGMLGTVLHETMRELYPEGTLLESGLLKGLLGDKGRIRAAVEKNICIQLNTFEVTGRNIVFADVVCAYVEAVLRSDMEQAASGGIRILGVEKEGRVKIGGYDFLGYIDRLDSAAPGTLRVVDYKTGRVEAEDLFFGNDPEKLPHIGLQLYLYKRFAEASHKGAEVSGAIYRPASLMSGSPVTEHLLDEEFCARMEEGLERLLGQISDLSVPWRRTEDAERCKRCDFRAICGR